MLFIPKQDIEHVQYVAFHVQVINSDLFQTKTGLHLLHHINNQAINLAQISYTGLCLVILTVGTLLNFHTGRHLMKILTKLFRLQLTVLMITWIHWFKQEIYGAINTRYLTTMGYYVIKFLPESYILQEDTPCYVQISTCG